MRPQSSLTGAIVTDMSTPRESLDSAQPVVSNTRSQARWIRTLTTAAVMVVLLCAGTAAATPRRSTPATIPSGTRSALLSVAVAIAARHGDGHPYDIEAVRTTRRTAARVLSTGETRIPDPNATVYIVAMRGHFNCNSCSHPRGTTFEPNRVITLRFVDPADLSSVVFGYGRPYPNLAAAGTPVHL